MTEDDRKTFRRVYFFRIEFFTDIKHSLPNAMRRIQDLEFDDTGRYLLNDKSDVRFSAYPDNVTYPLKVRFGKIRRNGLPQIEQAGDIENLPLKEDQGLIDISHITIFEDGIVAAEFNPDGPKLAALGPYIFQKGKLNTAPKFLSLAERDIVEVIRNFDAVRVLDIHIPPDAVNIVREADDNLAVSIAASAALGANKRVGLSLAADRPTRKLRDLALKLAEIVKSRPQESRSISKLSVRGLKSGTKSLSFVDILESKLVSGEFFIKNSERSRSLCSDEAYKTIERVYIENVDRIRSAATIFEML